MTDYIRNAEDGVPYGNKHNFIVGATCGRPQKIVSPTLNYEFRIPNSELKRVAAM